MHLSVRLELRAKVYEIANISNKPGRAMERLTAGSLSSSKFVNTASSEYLNSTMLPYRFIEEKED